MVTPAHHLPDVTAALVAKSLAQPQADTFIDQVLRFDATTLVVDEFLAFMRGNLESDACIRRGRYQRAYVDKLLAAPEGWFTRIQGSKLWHLALLELWLQLNVDAPCCSATSTGPSQARTETS